MYCPGFIIIKYIPLQQGLRHLIFISLFILFSIIKYIPLQQGLRHHYLTIQHLPCIIKYIPLQQGLRHLIPIFSAKK